MIYLVDGRLANVRNGFALQMLRLYLVTYRIAPSPEGFSGRVRATVARVVLRFSVGFLAVALATPESVVEGETTRFAEPLVDSPILASVPPGEE